MGTVASVGVAIVAYRAAYKNPQVRTCPECQKEFTTAFESKKYCSHDCRSIFNARINNNKTRRQPDTKVCPTCDNEFTTAYRKKKYCSQLCQEARNKRIFNEKYPPIKSGRARDGSWVTINRTSPIEDLGHKDFAAIQLIWHTFDYVPLFIFPDTRDVREVYDTLLSKEMFHEWVVYTIIFQSHLLWRYEMLVQIPGLVKADFLRLCQKYRITLQDSEAFAEDIKGL